MTSPKNSNEKIPLFMGDLKEEGIISPTEKSANRLRLKQINNFSLPKNVILCFFKDFYKIISEDYSPEVIDYHDDFKIYVFKYKEKDVAFLYPTMGSYAGMILEEMIALGAENIIFIGGAGTLSDDIKRGDIILPRGGIRDEGVSYNYESPSFISHPDEGLYNSIKNTLIRNKCRFIDGLTWTVSSFYREIPSKIDAFCKEGAVCTEMEAASFFSIGRFRGVKIAGLFIAGDSIANKRWSSLKTQENINKIREDRKKILIYALESFKN